MNTLKSNLINTFKTIALKPFTLLYKSFHFFFKFGFIWHLSNFWFNSTEKALKPTVIINSNQLWLRGFYCLSWKTSFIILGDIEAIHEECTHNFWVFWFPSSLVLTCPLSVDKPPSTFPYVHKYLEFWEWIYYIASHHHLLLTCLTCSKE